MAKITVGKRAPDFRATATGDETIVLSELAGKNVVLYFYPKDNTPGCTREAEAFNLARSRFKKRNTVILGVSRDNLRSHERFCDKYALQFPLISDEDETLCGLFDVIRQKNMYGKTVRGIERSTFLIDSSGILRREWRGVKVDGHVEEVLEAVNSFGKIDDD